MRRTITFLSAVLLLSVGPAAAQEKMKDSAKPGHEGMAKTGGGRSDAALIAKATSAAPPDIGRNAAVMGTAADGKMKELRPGTNGWMCMLDLAGDSMIIDPMGEVLASAAGVETILTADVDPGVVAAVRERFPFLADRRS